MRRNFKAATALLMAGVMAVTTLGGCSSKGSSTGETVTAGGPEAKGDEKVTIKFENFSAAGDNEVFLKEMIGLYEKENPNVTIELQTVPFKGYTDQLMAKVAGGQAADVYELSISDFAGFAGTGVLMDMNAAITSTGCDTSLYNANALQAFQMDGKQYGIPNSFSNVMLFYNKDLFDQAGVAYPTSDWDWDDTLEAAKKIRELDDKTYGYFRPVSFNELYKMAVQNGGSILNEDKTAFTVNTPEVIETVEYMTDIVTKYNVMPTDEQLGGIGDWDLFKSGRLGMIFTGIWGIPDFTRDCSFNWDIAVEPGKEQKATHFFSNAFVINKNSKVSEAAMDFIVFMTSNPEVANIRVKNGWDLPPITNEEVIASYTSQTPPENRESVFEALDYIVTPPVVEQSALLQDIVGKHLESVLLGQKTAAEAMENCQRELDETIKLK